MKRACALLGLPSFVLLVGFVAPSCATATTESEPPRSRPPEVVGLVPLSEPGSAEATTRPARAVSGRIADTSAPESLPALSSPPTGDACAALLGPRSVKRAALGRTLDAGLGTWLKGVDVEAKIDRGHFQGWLVRSLYAGDPCWTNVDLRAGDVVTRINRHSVQRPEEAQVVWTALRSSDEIVVDYVRDGKPRSVKFAVVDAPE